MTLIMCLQYDTSSRLLISMMTARAVGWGTVVPLGYMKQLTC